MVIRFADILILGAGLAGLRAAIAAGQAAPNAKILVASATASASGSSFANIHNRLGMQVCETDAEREAFVREAVSVAAPGRIDERLAVILAEDSQARLNDLVDLGLTFERGPDGGLVRNPGCFSPHSRRAAVFHDLPRAFRLLKDKARALGVAFLPNLTVLSLLVDHGAPRAVGALCRDETSGELVALAAGAVICSLGGPAPLFPLNQAGPDNPGYALALLDRAGARLTNQAYLQFMWAEVPGKAFFRVARLAEPGAGVLDARGRLRTAGDELGETEASELARSRDGHCPYGHGLPDARLDEFAAAHIGADHTATVALADGTALAVSPMAHAGNGGAAVNEFAATGVPGLYAAGECATLMHGANRIGGAMVLATQVFGNRAGEAAARLAAPCPDQSAVGALASELASRLVFDPDERTRGRARLAEGLQRHLILSGRPGLADFAKRLDIRHEIAKDHELKLALTTARLIARAALDKE